MIQFARENKALIFMFAFFLFVLELEIFISASLKAGDHSKIQVINANDEVLYETSEKKLYQFDKYYFESNFGPLENYRIRRIKEERPFPFRGWVISAVGIPIGFMMILGFIVKAWAVFFKGEKPAYDQEPLFEPTGDKGKFIHIIHAVSKLNIFVLGFFIVASLILYWVLPDMIIFISKMGIETLVRFKWFFISAFLIITSIFIWFIYLRFLLAKKAIESRTEIEKLRLQIIHDTDNSEIAKKLIEYQSDEL